MTEQGSRGTGSPGRYGIERLLGRGGMAAVYLAYDRSLARAVAVKALAEHFADDEALRARFLREARLAASLVHPNVVRVYDVGDDAQGPFIVMEHVEGNTLAEELQRRGRLSAAEAVAIGVQICSALDAAHAAGLVHRDIKPQNILRRPDGHVKIADFGIARSLADTRLTEVGTVLGTAEYLSPEQARGDPVTAASDTYSIGVVLYEILTGQPPFRATTLSELFRKREDGRITPLHRFVPDVPPSLETVVLQCLEPRAEDRPASVAILRRSLVDSIGRNPPTDLIVPPSRARDERSAVTEVLPALANMQLKQRPAASGRNRLTRHAGQRRKLIAVGAILVAAAAAVIVAYATSGTNPQAAGGGARTTSTQTSTAPARLVSSTVPSTSARSPLDQAIADAHAAAEQAQASAQLDGSATADLNHRLDAIAQAVASTTPSQQSLQTAAELTEALRGRVGELADDGRLTQAGLAIVSVPLGRLAGLLPPAPVQPKVAENVPGNSHGRGHAKRPKHGHGGD